MLSPVLNRVPKNVELVPAAPAMLDARRATTNAQSTKSRFRFTPLTSIVSCPIYSERRIWCHFSAMGWKRGEEQGVEPSTEPSVGRTIVHGSDTTSSHSSHMVDASSLKRTTEDEGKEKRKGVTSGGEH
jgi:hypothetical protein